MGHIVHELASYVLTKTVKIPHACTLEIQKEEAFLYIKHRSMILSRRLLEIVGNNKVVSQADTYAFPHGNKSKREYNPVSTPSLYILTVEY